MQRSRQEKRILQNVCSMSERLGFAASLHLLHTEGTMNNGEDDDGDEDGDGGGQ